MKVGPVVGGGAGSHPSSIITKHTARSGSSRSIVNLWHATQSGAREAHGSMRGLPRQSPYPMPISLPVMARQSNYRRTCSDPVSLEFQKLRPNSLRICRSCVLDGRFASTPFMLLRESRSPPLPDLWLPILLYALRWSSRSARQGPRHCIGGSVGVGKGLRRDHGGNNTSERWRRSTPQPSNPATAIQPRRCRGLLPSLSHRRRVLHDRW
jgi:hypothetical protein